MELNNRELAGLIGLGIIALALVGIRSTREALPGLIKLFVQPVILVPILTVVAYAFVLVVLAERLGLWEERLLVETVFWVAGPGMVLFFGVATRKRDDQLLRQTVRRAFGATAFLQVAIGFFVFSLPIELILLPVMTFLLLLSMAAETREDARPVQRIVDALLTVIVLGLLTYAVTHIVAEWDTLDTAYMVRALFLPLYLTVGFLPYLSVIGLWTSYDHAFRFIDHATEDTAARRRAKLGLILALRRRTALARSLTLFQARAIAEAGSFADARAVAHGFLEDEQRKEREAREAAERLKRNAGVEGTGEDGRRLDQREFEETRRALQWLATAEMGWYRNPGSHYRDDLLQMLAPFEGLPEDHGIELSVPPDGQSWWAWRRTITGWCFAIGAAEPPPDQWLYDGSDPPSGFPGEDPAWGGRFGVDAANW